MPSSNSNPAPANSASETAALANAVSPTTPSGGLAQTSGLSLMDGQPGSAKGRKVAILVAEGVDGAQVEAARAALAAAGAIGEVVGPTLGTVPGAAGVAVTAARTYANAASVLYDAVYVPGGMTAATTMLRQTGDAREFVSEAYKHGKPIASSADGVQLVAASDAGGLLRATGATGAALRAQGVFVLEDADGRAAGETLAAALVQHRFPLRGALEQLAAWRIGDAG